MKKKRTCMALILVMLAVGIGICGYSLFDDWNQAQDPTAQTALKPNIDQNTDAPPMDFSGLTIRNPDIVVWLTIEDTAIDYPVVQGTDNSYYLTHNAEKQDAKAGALFLDYRNTPDFSDSNSIIYGHNMKAGTMFAQLVRFKEKDFFDSHKTGWLYTPERTYKLQIFAVSVTKSIDYPYTWAIVSPKDFENFLGQVRQNAKYLHDADIQYGDRILTMSTCSYEFTDARTVVFAKLV